MKQDKWLTPLVSAAEWRDEIDIHGLMWQAGATPSTEDVEALVIGNAPPGDGAYMIDRVQIGQLLIHALGWDDFYPAYPPEDAESFLAGDWPDILAEVARRVAKEGLRLKIIGDDPEHMRIWVTDEPDAENEAQQ
jgi:hypothetical protein